jgi:uncharacterized iron-regulated membrane protein
MAFFLVVAGLTGSIIAFVQDLRDWLNPPVTVVQRASPRLDDLTLRERALALLPQGRSNYLSLRHVPGAAYTITFEPRTDPATDKPFDLAFPTAARNSRAPRVRTAYGRSRGRTSST